MPMYVQQNSFAGGEFSPDMDGRCDLEKYNVAAKTLLNFIVHPSGSASNRPGFRYIATAKYANRLCWLIPFQFSVLQAYMLEFGHQYIRFYMNGAQITTAPGSGVPYEIATPYADTDLRRLKFTQSADTMYLCHPNHPPMVLTRTGHTAWTLTQFVNKNGPFMKQNTVDSSTITPSATTGSINLTASASIFGSGHVNTLWQISHNIDGPTTSGSFSSSTVPITSGIIATNDQWKLVTHGTWTGKIRIKISYDDGNTWRVIRSYSSNNDNNVIDSDTIDQEQIENGIIPQLMLECYSYSSGAINYDLTGFPYVVNGVAQITGVADSQHAAATVISQLGATTATNTWAEGSWSTVRGFPAADLFYDNRMLFAATAAEPCTAWFSKAGDYNNFAVSYPPLDSDAVTAPLISRSVNVIHSLVSLNDILAFTQAAEWKISAGNNSSITPTNVLAKTQGYRGASNVDPIVVGNRVLFIQQMGSTVRDMGYQWAVDLYTGDDLTVLARHLFDNHSILQWSYQQTPDTIIWAIRDDGLLLGLTYLKEHDIWAWHQHQTQGAFESIANIPGTGYDEVWVVVNRTINGQTVRFIERLDPRMVSTQPADQFFVDAGATYSGSPATTISGLDYLEGEMVSILADGNVMPQQVVNGGRVALTVAASKVHVGLPYVCDLAQLDIDFQARDGTVDGRKKKVSRVCLKLKDTRGGFVGPDVNKMYEMKMRSGENYDTPIALFTGEKWMAMAGGYNSSGSVLIRQIDPLPITVLSIVRECDLGGA